VIGILRVVAGIVKGHKLKTVKGMKTRPTSDMVKEALFNIIAGYVKEAEVLDIFAGTGSLGIEALSRGAKSAVFIDTDREAISVIRQNLESTRLANKAEIIKGDAFSVLDRLGSAQRKFDIILLDPPYHKNFVNETLKIVQKHGIIKPDGIIAVERDEHDSVNEAFGTLKLVRDQKYGGTVLSFYRLV
jgi:16S rRNA (guanine966-N2)-methyltransferase